MFEGCCQPGLQKLFGTDGSAMRLNLSQEVPKLVFLVIREGGLFGGGLISCGSLSTEEEGLEPLPPVLHQSICHNNESLSTRVSFSCASKARGGGKRGERKGGIV